MDIALQDVQCWPALGRRSRHGQVHLRLSAAVGAEPHPALGAEEVLRVQRVEMERDVRGVNMVWQLTIRSPSPVS